MMANVLLSNERTKQIWVVTCRDDSNDVLDMVPFPPPYPLAEDMHIDREGHLMHVHICYCCKLNAFYDYPWHCKDCYDEAIRVPRPECSAESALSSREPGGKKRKLTSGKKHKETEAGPGTPPQEMD